MTTKTVLVAGSAGYLGRYVVRKLKQNGYRVRAFFRSPQKMEQMGGALSSDITDAVDEVFIGDVIKPESLSGVAEGVDTVFSSVSLMGQKSKLSWHDVDYLGNQNPLNGDKKAGVKQFVYISVFNAQKW